jgi:hypothetical protein
MAVIDDGENGFCCRELPWVVNGLQEVRDATG